MCISFAELNAQVFLGNSDEQVTSSSLTRKKAADTTVKAEQKQEATDSKYKSLTDYAVDLDFDNKIYGFGIGGDHAHFGVTVGEDIYGFTFGYGFGGSSVSEDFLLQGRLYPYVSYSSIDTGDDTDSEFTWGVAASLSAGVKIYKTAKGNSLFLTFGYGVSAPELETKDMFDYGMWRVGLTLVCW